MAEIYDGDDARRSALTNAAFALVFATIGLIVAGVAVGGLLGFACLMGALALGLPLSSVVQARERLEERGGATRPTAGRSLQPRAVQRTGPRGGQEELGGA